MCAAGAGHLKAEQQLQQPTQQALEGLLATASPLEEAFTKFQEYQQELQLGISDGAKESLQAMLQVRKGLACMLWVERP